MIYIYNKITHDFINSLRTFIVVGCSHVLHSDLEMKYQKMKMFGMSSYNMLSVKLKNKQLKYHK